MPGARGGPTTTEAALADPALCARLVAHARAWYPLESCALLVADGADADVVLADNLAPAADAGGTYALDPRLLVAAEAAGRVVLAIVHSHCDVGAYWSEEDARRATTPAADAPLFPGVDYVVLDARAAGVPEARVFRWSTPRRAFAEVERLDLCEPCSGRAAPTAPARSVAARRESCDKPIALTILRE